MAKKRTRSKGRGRQSKVTQASRRRKAATMRRRAANARARSMSRRKKLRYMLASAAANEALRREWEADELRRELEAYPFEWHKRQSFY